MVGTSTVTFSIEFQWSPSFDHSESQCQRSLQLSHKHRHISNGHPLDVHRNCPTRHSSFQGFISLSARLGWSLQEDRFPQTQGCPNVEDPGVLVRSLLGPQTASKNYEVECWPPARCFFLKRVIFLSNPRFPFEASSVPLKSTWITAFFLPTNFDSQFQFNRETETWYEHIWRISIM